MMMHEGLMILLMRMVIQMAVILNQNWVAQLMILMIVGLVVDQIILLISNGDTCIEGSDSNCTLASGACDCEDSVWDCDGECGGFALQDCAGNCSTEMLSR